MIKRKTYNSVLKNFFYDYDFDFDIFVNFAEVSKYTYRNALYYYMSGDAYD
jgi:hypothetical protein